MVLNIKDKLIIGLLIFIVVLIGCCVAAFSLSAHYKEKYNTEHENVSALLQGQQNYKVRDSLNAVKVQELEVSLSTYKQFHEDDVQLIKDLGLKVSNVEHVIKTNTETKYNVITTVKDSLLYDTIPVQNINYKDTYLTLNGTIINSKFNGNIESRDTIAIVETIKWKRFLGFLWKTGIKHHELDVVSKNPHTKLNVESVKIK